MVHPGLLGVFGPNEGRKSRVFKRAAIVGAADRAPCVLVSAPCEDREYTLVSLVSCTPKQVDEHPEVLDRNEEFRFYSWDHLRRALSQLGQGDDGEMLDDLASRSGQHLSC